MPIALFAVQAAAALFLVVSVTGRQWPMTAMGRLIVVLLPVTWFEGIV